MNTQTKPAPIGKIRLNRVRIAFPELFEAKSLGKGVPRFSASFLLTPDHPQLDDVNKLMIAVAKEKWGDKAAEVYKSLKASNKLAVHDGDTKSEYQGYPGNFYISAARQEKDGPPTVLDRDKTVLTARSGKIYSGCYVNAIINIWAQDHKEHGRRINASLAGVQFWEDGDAFSGARPADADDFDAAEGTDAEDFA